MCFYLLSSSAGAASGDDNIVTFVIAALLILVILSPFAVLVSSKKKLKKKRKERQEFLKNNNAIDCAVLNHAAGLPIAENVPCSLILRADSLEISGNGIKFNLSKTKITNVSVKTEEEIQNQYVSSTGGALAGGLMFGAVGAAIGGRAKKKETKTITLYLIITYKKDSGIDYLMFNIGTSASEEVISFLNNLETGIQKQDVNIEL